MRLYGPILSDGVVDRAMSFHADNAYFLPNARPSALSSGQNPYGIETRHSVVLADAKRRVNWPKPSSKKCLTVGKDALDVRKL